MQLDILTSTQGHVDLERRRVPVARLLALAGALGVVIGSFGAWITVKASVLSFSFGGFDRDGKITAPLGFVIVALLGLRLANRVGNWGSWLAFGLLAVTTAIGILDWNDVASHAAAISGAYGMSISVGWGLQLLTVGAAVGTVCALVDAVRARRNRSVLVEKSSVSSEIAPVFDVAVNAIVGDEEDPDIRPAA